MSIITGILGAITLTSPEPASSKRLEKKAVGNLTDRRSSSLPSNPYAQALSLIRAGEWSKLTSELCKAYLRYYGLRPSNSKADLISRIHRHYELKDVQSAKRQYPRASFFIDCTGDVCRNDIVFFNQRVSTGSVPRNERKATHGGYRSVAGRVVSESYGVKKQQHTFTVEVIWSSGLHALAPMTQLFVKGRVLYRHKTFRQKWPNEADRVAAIAEKHARGDEARSMREKRLANRPLQVRDPMAGQAIPALPAAGVGNAHGVKTGGRRGKGGPAAGLGFQYSEQDLHCMVKEVCCLT
ncbi:unnamed protein product [Closterium sp. Yama58-4]|nr:unnamed protein product [Closterium sp. Yama58-4]